jgi:SPX domain protein involved in polyphosphate accumulation
MAFNMHVFKRIEKKYKLSCSVKEQFMSQISNYITADTHTKNVGEKNTNVSLYLDTPDFRSIRYSLSPDCKIYKEKIRLRSYGLPTDDSTVFLELKKKFNGTGYKRRESMTLKEAYDYIYDDILPFESQIMSEIDYCIHFYGGLKPAMRIAYDREAFYAKDNQNLRFTFDSNIRYSNKELDLRKDFIGTKILSDENVILEIKSDGAMPMWLVKALSDFNIMPTSFSKYGTAYKSLLLSSNYIKNREEIKDVINF